MADKHDSSRAEAASRCMSARRRGRSSSRLAQRVCSAPGPADLVNFVLPIDPRSSHGPRFVARRKAGDWGHRDAEYWDARSGSHSGVLGGE